MVLAKEDLNPSEIARVRRLQGLEQDDLLSSELNVWKQHQPAFHEFIAWGHDEVPVDTPLMKSLNYMALCEKVYTGGFLYIWIIQSNYSSPLTATWMNHTFLNIIRSSIFSGRVE